jgi:(S)-sulfolactate dehydrogenase
MPDIVITEFMEDRAVASLSQRYDTLYDAELVAKPEDLAGQLAGARALIVRNRTQVDETLLAGAGALRVVGRLGVGLDNIALDACRARGIAVIPASGANDDSVAEYVIAGALMLRRGAYFASHDVAAGQWPRNRLMAGREVLGATLGLVGFGAIARAVARRAAALGMHLVAHDPHVADDDPAWGELNVAPRSLDALLEEADVVSLHVPLGEGTRNLIDAAALARMKPDAILINSARGGVVDEQALAEALRSQRLGAAMLDVFDTEPLPGGGPLSGVPNLILTPHIAGVTDGSNVRVSRMIADKVSAALEALA